MKYSILIYESPADFAIRTDPERAMPYWNGYMAYGKSLRDAGIMIGGAGLEPPETATTITLRGGTRQVQDGPYADTKEQLGGFYMIEVPTLDDALEWAARVPCGPGGVIEVRPNLGPPPAA